MDLAFREVISHQKSLQWSDGDRSMATVVLSEILTTIFVGNF